MTILRVYLFLGLHGRLDTLVCQKRSIHTLRVTPKDFQQRIISPCPECEAADKERVESGKRSHSICTWTHRHIK